MVGMKATDPVSMPTPRVKPTLDAETESMPVTELEPGSTPMTKPKPGSTSVTTTALRPQPTPAPEPWPTLVHSPGPEFLPVSA